MLARAAEEGARRALSDAGLRGTHAVPKPSLPEGIPFLRHMAALTALQVITTGLLLALLAGIVLKLSPHRLTPSTPTACLARHPAGLLFWEDP